MTFSLNNPEFISAPVVLSAPHCGVMFPADFLEQSPLSQRALLETADLGTDILVDIIENISSIKAHFARSYVDLNRARNQLDRGVIANLDVAQDAQTIAGYGVIPRFARHGALTHSAKISLADSQARLVSYYDPYHAALSTLLEEVKMAKGHAILIDVHSAPAHLIPELDVQIGTLHGQTCDSEVVRIVRNAFEAEGLRVGLELPFSGGHITRHYATLPNVQTLQIEVSRRNCVDQSNSCILSGSNEFLAAWRRAMSAIFRSLAQNTET